MQLLVRSSCKVGPRGVLIWGTLPCLKWIFDYGYYFEDAGIFIHAFESEYMKKEDANGNIIKGPNGETYEVLNPKGIVFFSYPERFRHYQEDDPTVQRTVYCVTCQGNELK